MSAHIRESNGGRRLLLRVAVGLIVVAVSTAPASAGLIINGSFEQGNFGGNPSFRRLTPGSNFLTGWTVGGVAVDWHNTAEMRFPHTGDKVLDLHLDGAAGSQGTLSQTFATTAGQWYELSFFLSGPGSNFGFPNPRSVNVSIAGIQQTFSTPASLNTNMLWGEHRLRFIATGNTTTLTFTSPHNGAGFWGPVLDDVDVNAIPEPASVSLFLAVGAAGLAVVRRRRAA
jgi:choice-of-anchor C domain-containing protein